MKENAGFAMKFRAVVFACMAFAIAGTSAPAAAVTLYAVDSAGILWLLDTSTSSKTQIGSSALPTNSNWFVGLDVNPADGKLYVSNSVTGDIYTVNTSTGATTFVTTVNVSSSPCGLGVTQNLAFSPSGILYGSETSSLCTIDPSGSSTFVGSDFSFYDDNGLAFAPNGTLYAIGQGGPTGRSLYTINPANGAKSFISPSPCFVGLTFAADGNLYCTDINANLYQVDPSNGAATPLFNTGLGAMNDLASASAAPPPVLGVLIDIKPGSFPNSINPRSQGRVPVAILSTNSFDASTVNVSTVAFGPGSAAPVHAALEDVNNDGRPDLIVHFLTQSTGIVCGVTSASLTGQTTGGQMILGTDSVNTAGCK